MPGGRLEAEATTLRRFSVVAEYAEPDDRCFVRHVALLRDDCRLQCGSDVEVWHVCPPVVAGERTGRAAPRDLQQCCAHAVGFLDDLTLDELAGIAITLAEIDDQTQPLDSPLKQYVVHPPVEWVTDCVTGTKRFRRFSCVGFVHECYDAGAGIRLLNLSEDMPQVDLTTLGAAYGEPVHRERIREQLGIVGKPPWSLVLPGYLMHSLSRSSTEIRKVPHVPSSVGEAAFPLH